MSHESRRLAGVLLVLLPTVVIGGVILGLLALGVGLLRRAPDGAVRVD